MAKKTKKTKFEVKVLRGFNAPIILSHEGDNKSLEAYCSELSDGFMYEGSFIPASAIKEIKTNIIS